MLSCLWDDTRHQAERERTSFNGMIYRTSFNISLVHRDNVECAGL